MSKFVDFDPMRGIETRLSYHTGEQQVHHYQDVEPIMDLADIERSQGLSDQAAKKHKWGEEVHLYARIPPVIIMEMKNKWGVDIFKRNHLKKAFELLNREYPKFKTTEKTHNLGKEVQVYLP